MNQVPSPAKTPPGRRIDVYPDLANLSRAAAAQFAELAASAVTLRGKFTVALSGGNTPKELYHLLASDFRTQLPWDRIHAFWGDERYVPFGDLSSNYGTARVAFLDPVGMPDSNIHPMPTSFADPAEAAAVYETTLRSFFSDSPPAFDLILLGMGSDGHIASLFPSSPALADTSRWVVGVEVDAVPPRRLSLTLPVINGARAVIVLVAGEEKRDAVRNVLVRAKKARRGLPATLLEGRGEVHWLLDREAAGEAFPART